jgi:hypothetical protein
MLKNTFVIATEIELAIKQGWSIFLNGAPTSRATATLVPLEELVFSQEKNGYTLVISRIDSNWQLYKIKDGEKFDFVKNIFNLKTLLHTIPKEEVA